MDWYDLERLGKIPLVGQDLSQALKNKESFIGRKVPRIYSRHRQIDDRWMSGGRVGGRKSDPARFVSGNYGRSVPKDGRGSIVKEDRRRWWVIL